MKKKNGILIALAVLFGASTLIFMILFISSLSVKNTYENQLENTYQKSYYQIRYPLLRLVGIAKEIQHKP